MRVFLSWSGQRSRQVANALRDWLPAVLQSVEPWLSSEDMPIGTRWAESVADVLQSADVGIICLTSENLASPWLLYEAGALSKRVSSSMVIPYLLDISPADIQGPLAFFQCARATREDTFRLLQVLNAKTDAIRLPDARLEKVFDAWWPQLEAQLTAITPAPAAAVAPPKVAAEVISPAQQALDTKLDQVLSLLQEIRRPSIAADLTAPPTVASSSVPPAPSLRPRIFIGSSSEGLGIAESLQLGLDAVAECTIWNQSAFNPSATTIENLVDIGNRYEAAILVLTPDDMRIKRQESAPVPRDNLIFEAGFFTGMLGRARTFLVHPREPQMELPSDLAGVTTAAYTTPSDGNLHAALGAVCTRIKRALGLAGANAG